MKSLILFAVGIIVFTLQYLILTAIVWMFAGGQYTDVMHNGVWIFVYVFLIGWMLPVIVLTDLTGELKAVARRRTQTTAALSR